MPPSLSTPTQTAQDPRAGRRLPTALLAWCLLTLALPTVTVLADDLPEADVYGFNDAPLPEPMDHPDWFKGDFLDLPEDMSAALAAGKSGLMVYFGQRRCAYCQKLLQVNFGTQDIVDYTRRHFDVVPIDIWGVGDVTTLGGKQLSEREFSQQEKTTFTPTILFYDRDGREALRLRGYYPPYQFRAALEYVADGHYQRESFRSYLARGDNRMVFDAEDMNEEDYFSPSPINLDRSGRPGERPLAVFFEQGDCHACDVLHGQALREAEIAAGFEAFDNVQIGLWSDTPVITPDGRRLTARQWAEELGLFYAPSIVFFDEAGREILRVDSVVAFYRLRNVLAYLHSGAYRTGLDYPRWRELNL
jgi:thioredoxin-related protein